MMRKISFMVGLILVLVVPCSLSAQEGQALSKDGTPIYYSVYGKGEPVLVFIHGWSCNSSFWRKQVPYFEKNYRVVVLDLAGHGKSGAQRTDYSMRSFAEDVAAVVQAVGSGDVILIGHSMAGAVILEAAQIMPEKIEALIGIDTMQDFEEEYTAQQVEEITAPFKEDFKKATTEFLKSMFVAGTDTKFIEEITAAMSSASPKVGISAMEDMFKISYVLHPPKIKAPIWCLNADLWPTKADINRLYVPEFNLRIMPGVGHFLMLEKPDEFNQKLDSIIKEIQNRGVQA